MGQFISNTNTNPLNKYTNYGSVTSGLVYKKPVSPNSTLTIGGSTPTGNGYTNAINSGLVGLGIRPPSGSGNSTLTIGGPNDAFNQMQNSAKASLAGPDASQYAKPIRNALLTTGADLSGSKQTSDKTTPQLDSFSTSGTFNANPNVTSNGSGGNTPYTPVKGVLPTGPTQFGTYVADVRNASNPNATQTGLIKDIRDVSARNQQLGENAQNIANKYGSEIARVGQLGAGAVAGDLSTGTNVVGSGNAAIASQSASSRMDALANALNSELQGNQQALTANDLQNTGLNYALGGANTQQQQQLSGLSSAANYAQPNVAGYGQTVFDPLTGTYTGGSGNLDPQNVAQDLANRVKNGQMTYEQAVASLGYAGGAGAQFLNQALGNGFNAPLSTAQIQGSANVLGGVPALESANTAAEGVKNKITTYLQQNPQLNPSNLAAGNMLQQWIQGKQLSDPKYQTLFNYLNEYTNTLAPILGVGGDATNLKTQIAQSFINAAASGQSIAQVLENMSQLATGKIQDIKSGAIGGGVVSSPYTNSGSGTGSGGLYSF